MFAVLRRLRHQCWAFPSIKSTALYPFCLCWLLASCASGPLPKLSAGADPADPKGRTPGIGYQSVTDGYVAGRPASPVLPGADAGARAKAKP